jgi:Protein of unknown function (DUF3987)/Bifunctional DNA primase/polymerase, N-terminal
VSGLSLRRPWVRLTSWSTKFKNGVPSVDDRATWGRGNTGVGVICGPASRGVVGFDIDTDDPEIVAAIRAVLPPSPVKKAGAKGETLFYFGPRIEASKSWNIAGRRVLDLIGPGRQTVLPPSVHPDTKLKYYWTGSETLEDLAPRDLPEVAPDIVDKISAALAAFGYEPEIERAPYHSSNGGGGSIGGGGGDPDSPHRALNETALANLEKWVPALGLYRCRPTRLGYEAVPAWRPSSTGREPEQRHLNLKIVPAGIRDFGADRGYTPLDLVMAADGCDLDTAFRFLNRRLDWAPATSPFDLQVDGTTNAGQAEDHASASTGAERGIGARTVAGIGAGTSAAGTGVASINSPPGTGAPAGNVEALEAYTHVPGAVGAVVDWIAATARRPNRVLALGAAITIVGTLIGRRVAGPTRSATHLYVVPIAGTGTGKQHILDATMRLLHAAKAGNHIGPSKFFSLSAVCQMLMEKPLALCLQDEIGVFLKSVTSKKASSHEAAVSQILRTLWGISFAATTMPQWGNPKIRMPATIKVPALSILGISTPEEFYGALQGDSIGNGFLNRFLALVSEARTNDTDPALDPGAVPAALAEELYQLYLWSGPESLLQIGNYEAELAPDVLPWASDAARARYLDFTRMLDARMDGDPAIKPYIARCSEIAIRLATIRAAGRWGPGATVDLADVQWGAGIAWTAGQSLAAKAIDYLPDNERGEMTGKIAGIIRRSDRALKPRDIQQFIRGRLKSAEIKDILGQLVEAGEIAWTGDGYQAT